MLLRTHLIAKSNWRQSTGSLQKASWAQLFSGNKLTFDVCPHLQKYSQEVWNLSSASPDIDCLINCTSIRTTFVQNVATYWVKTESIAVTFVMEIPQPTVRTHYFFSFDLYHSLSNYQSILSFLRRHYIWIDYIIGCSEFGLPAGRYVGPFSSCLVAGLRDALTISSSHHAVLAIWYIIKHIWHEISSWIFLYDV